MNKEDCEVSSNCMKSYDCDWCKDYNEYSPVNRNILSPAQKKKREKKKAERKIKKLSSASKRGKANRRNGRAAERQVEDLLNNLGLNAKRTPMSGALKAGNLIYGLQSKISGDIRIDYKGNNLIVECKRNIHADSWWKLLDEGVIHITQDGLWRSDRKAYSSTNHCSLQSKVEACLSFVIKYCCMCL